MRAAVMFTHRIDVFCIFDIQKIISLLNIRYKFMNISKLSREKKIDNIFLLHLFFFRLHACASVPP